eukprot:852507-Pyramimonas_sp.AAC.1
MAAAGSYQVEVADGIQAANAAHARMRRRAFRGGVSPKLKRSECGNPWCAQLARAAWRWRNSHSGSRRQWKVSKFAISGTYFTQQHTGTRRPTARVEAPN